MYIEKATWWIFQTIVIHLLNKFTKFEAARKFTISEEDLEENKNLEMIGDVLQDGDEFLFKIVSFDKWITINLNFELDEYPDVRFCAKTEMRVAGCYPNSYFFNLIQKLAINIWNVNIQSLRPTGEFYVISNIKFTCK